MNFVLSEMVAYNYLIHAIKLPYISVLGCIGAVLLRIYFSIK